MKSWCALLLSILLSACGQTGPLYMPGTATGVHKKDEFVLGDHQQESKKAPVAKNTTKPAAETTQPTATTNSDTSVATSADSSIAPNEDSTPLGGQDPEPQGAVR